MDKRKLTAAAILLAALTILVTPTLSACSTFVMQRGGRVLFGRNFDFFTGVGCLMVNPRGVDKTALVYPGEKPASWTALYGSVTFNQVGRDFPMGGMNEKGLVLENMWLAAGEYPQPDGRPGMTELQWIQYQLDTCQTVEEVLASDAKVRILPGNNKIHFLACDRSGAAAVIEFIGGKSLLRGPKDLPVRVLTNTPLQGCLDDLPKYPAVAKGKGRGYPESWKDDHSRFALIARGLRTAEAKGRGFGVDAAFDLLDQASYPGADSPTQWRVVYDVTAGELHFRTRHNMEKRSLRLSGLDFDCRSKGKVIDLDGLDKGDIAGKMIPYTADFNRELTRNTFAIWKKSGFNTEMNDMVVMFIGNQPETNRCR